MFLVRLQQLIKQLCLSLVMNYSDKIRGRTTKTAKFYLKNGTPFEDERMFTQERSYLLVVNSNKLFHSVMTYDKRLK